jgi:hypothetical protein
MDVGLSFGMKGIIFALIWCLILLAASYDGYFAWQNRMDFEHWETNPFARWMVQSFCLEAMVVVKGLGVGFATIIALCCHRMRNRLAFPLTAFVACCYLVLSIHYTVGFMSKPQLAHEPAFASRVSP